MELRGAYGLKSASGSPIPAAGGAAGAASRERGFNGLSDRSHLRFFCGREPGGFCSELSWRNFILLRMEKSGLSLGISVG